MRDRPVSPFFRHIKELPFPRAEFALASHKSARAGKRRIVHEEAESDESDSRRMAARAACSRVSRRRRSSTMARSRVRSFGCCGYVRPAEAASPSFCWTLKIEV